MMPAAGEWSGFVTGGYLAVLGVSFAEFIGLPVPSSVLLLYIGAMSLVAGLNVVALIALAALGALIADAIWFSVGRRHGKRLVSLYCTVSLSCDDCTHRTDRFFARYGLRALLFAKFVPGFSTFASPMAGHSGAAFGRFLRWDTAGALIWSGVLIGAGRLLGARNVGLVQAQLGRVGPAVGWFVGALVVLYFAYKIVRRARYGPAQVAEVCGADPTTAGALDADAPGEAEVSREAVE